MKLDHCVIHVSDWERSNAFYRDVLGAELIDRGHLREHDIRLAVQSSGGARAAGSTLVARYW